MSKLSVFIVVFFAGLSSMEASPGAEGNLQTQTTQMQCQRETFEPNCQIPCEEGNWVRCRTYSARNRRYQAHYGSDAFCLARNWVKCDDGREGYIRDDVEITEVVLATFEYRNGGVSKTIEESYLPEAVIDEYLGIARYSPEERQRMPESFIHTYPIVSGRKILTVGKLFETGNLLGKVHEGGALPYTHIQRFKVDKETSLYEDAEARTLLVTD